MLLEAIGAALHERFLGVTTYQTCSDISIIAVITVSGTISRMVMATCSMPRSFAEASLTSKATLNPNPNPNPSTQTPKYQQPAPRSPTLHSPQTSSPH
jgi:ABC-type uncharacterized transport system involved in gliding motility auxiliary subunit